MTLLTHMGKLRRNDMTKIKTEYKDGMAGKTVLVLTKKGKFSLTDIEEFLRYESNRQFQGYYAIIINASESTCEGSGWMDEVYSKEESVVLYPLEDSGDCPICGKLLIINCCPECGTELRN